MSIPTQSVRQAVNKRKLYGFRYVSSGATSSCIMSATQIQSLGYHGISDISVVVSNASGCMAFGKAASSTAGHDVIPLVEDKILTLENINAKDVSFIRWGGTDIVIEGYMVLY